MTQAQSSPSTQVRHVSSSIDAVVGSSARVVVQIAVADGPPRIRESLSRDPRRQTLRRSRGRPRLRCSHPRDHGRAREPLHPLRGERRTRHDLPRGDRGRSPRLLAAQPLQRVGQARAAGHDAAAVGRRHRSSRRARCGDVIRQRPHVVRGRRQPRHRRCGRDPALRCGCLPRLRASERRAAACAGHPGASGGGRTPPASTRWTSTP